MSCRREMTECRSLWKSFPEPRHPNQGTDGGPARFQSFCGPQMAKCLPIPLPFEWTESPISMLHCVLCAGHLSAHFRSHGFRLRATTQKGLCPNRLCAPGPDTDDEVLDFAKQLSKLESFECYSLHV